MTRPIAKASEALKEAAVEIGDGKIVCPSFW
jgi:hypothetical protein